MRERARLAAVAGVGALAVRLTSSPPPPRTIEGLANMLGEEVGGVVDPTDIAWEPSPGFLTEALLGRRLLFLASPAPDGPRDLYRARVRVTRDGKPITARAVRNITCTPLGDDAGLAFRDGVAVFATVAFGRVQGISVLETSGIRPGDEPAGVLDRLLLRITSLRRTGSVAGLGRTDLVFEMPAREAKVVFEPPKLRIEIPGPGRSLTFDAATRSLLAADGGQADGARAIVQRHGHKPLVLWLVDTTRAEVGPGPIAWAENVAFGLRDTLKRTWYAFGARSEAAMLKVVASGPQASALPHVADAQELVEEAPDAWPPPSPPSIWQKAELGEGEWQPVTDAWLEPARSVEGAAAPPYFFQTFIRPDPKRPYSRLTLIAMDMRQLELGMQAGFEDPKPLTGPSGLGRLPRDPDVLSRVVATFNGAFKTDHGKYGMMVERRVLLPPVPGGASIVINDDRRVGLGNWPRGEEIPAEVVSYRQNLDPLVEDGVVNPSGRFVWGWQLAGTSVMTQRTAVCVTPAGQLYYAFGDDIDAPTLSKGLRQAGCSYAIHLDMNPKHCGFVYTDVVDINAKKYNLRVADPRMQINPDRYITWSAKDFFYVMVRDPRPRSKSTRWEVDPGTHPDPSFIPAVFKAERSVGRLRIELRAFDSERITWRVRAGTLEPTSPDAPPKLLELSPRDRAARLAAIGLGHTTAALGCGLAFGQIGSLPFQAYHATLVVRTGELPKLLGADEPATLCPEAEAVQLPLLADRGELLAYAQQTSELRQRGALCVSPDGWVYTAHGRNDSSAPLAKALLDLGCTRVAELDRGSRHSSFVHRGGTDSPPGEGYEASVLYAVSAPMPPRAYRWLPPGATRATEPSTHDIPKAKIEKMLEETRSAAKSQ